MRIHRSEKLEIILECANYCIQYNWSIRTIARNIGISKTTVHRYITQDLKYVDSQKYNQCKHILESRRNM